jgi:hypothetical protein
LVPPEKLIRAGAISFGSARSFIFLKKWSLSLLADSSCRRHDSKNWEGWEQFFTWHIVRYRNTTMNSMLEKLKIRLTQHEGYAKDISKSHGQAGDILS